VMTAAVVVADSGEWRRGGRHDAAAGVPPHHWAAVVGGGGGGQVRVVQVVGVRPAMTGDRRSGAVTARRWATVRPPPSRVIGRRGQRGGRRRRRRRGGGGRTARATWQPRSGVSQLPSRLTATPPKSFHRCHSRHHSRGRCCGHATSGVQPQPPRYHCRHTSIACHRYRHRRVRHCRLNIVALGLRINEFTYQFCRVLALSPHRPTWATRAEP
jgi:hypothetical protein